MSANSSQPKRPQRHREVDARVDNALIEVKFGVDALRTIRTSLMQVAYPVGEEPVSHGYIVLVDSPITIERLRDEWERASTVLRSDVLNRLTICLQTETGFTGIPRDPDVKTQRMLAEVVEKERGNISTRSSEPYYDILRILINRWIKRAGPLTSLSLAEFAGCAYPTVALALEKLEKYLIRHSDRRVELKAFPKDAWFRLVANADKVRQTLLFADHSGQPRPVESLVFRLQRIQPTGVAIGGVLGARRIFPTFDLIGTARLDLTVHCRTRKPDLSFLRQLDPALKPARYDEPARLAIHTLRQPKVFFETTSDGAVWADPVECLLDLHEMRLESQAAEFLQLLTPA